MSHTSQPENPASSQSPAECQPILLDLVAHLDGELAPEREAAVRGHLEACGACQAEKAALDGAWQHLAVLPGLEARPGLWSELEGAILSEAGAESSLASQAPSERPAGQLLRFPLWARAGTLAAGALLTAGVAFWATRQAAPTHGPSSGSGEVAVQSPAPSRALLPDPLRMPSPDASPDAPEPEGPDFPPIVLPKRPEQRPSVTPEAPSTPPDTAVAQGPGVDPLEGLDAEDQQVIEDLELLVALESQEADPEAELDGEDLDLLDELEEEVLDELAG
jgi:hypothetical protein